MHVLSLGVKGDTQRVVGPTNKWKVVKIAAMLAGYSPNPFHVLLPPSEECLLLNRAPAHRPFPARLRSQGNLYSNRNGVRTVVWSADRVPFFQRAVHWQRGGKTEVWAERSHQGKGTVGASSNVPLLRNPEGVLLNCVSATVLIVYWRGKWHAPRDSRNPDSYLGIVFKTGFISNLNRHLSFVAI